MSHERLFADPATALRAVEAGEKHFVQFASFPFDVFEVHFKNHSYRDDRARFTEMQSCMGCHYRPGVFGFNSYSGRYSDPPSFYDSSIEGARQYATSAKKFGYDWGLLEGMLRSQAPPR